MKICNLGSGSDGNCTYVQTLNSKILVDIGFSCKEICTRLNLLNVKPEEIDAILITHEHSDHIKGLDVFAKTYGTKVYVHQKGVNALKSKLKHAHKLQFILFDDLDFFIKDLKVSSTCLSHDSEYCCGFTFLENTKKVSILTDLGYTNAEVLSKVLGSTLVYLESNHDVEMLKNNANYPGVLKQRILGKRGHLSNTACAEAIKELACSGTKQIMLSHLSTENNTPSLAYNTICDYLKLHNIIEGENIKIAITSTKPSYIFNLN